MFYVKDLNTGSVWKCKTVSDVAIAIPEVDPYFVKLKNLTSISVDVGDKHYVITREG